MIYKILLWGCASGMLFVLFQYNLKLVQDNDLSEFDESRDIIESLVDEYKACESPDYIKWGMEVDPYLLNFSLLLFVWQFPNECIFFCAGPRPPSNRRRQCFWNSGSKITSVNISSKLLYLEFLINFRVFIGQQCIRIVGGCLVSSESLIYLYYLFQQSHFITSLNLTAYVIFNR